MPPSSVVILPSYLDPIGGQRQGSIKGEGLAYLAVPVASTAMRHMYGYASISGAGVVAYVLIARRSLTLIPATPATVQQTGSWLAVHGHNAEDGLTTEPTSSRPPTWNLPPCFVPW
ncbi:hypothetical protein ColTof4_02059 [Colletotrichum tofieldiae]|nr:hypothetical protein ColTof3_09656 [Colletotrichum tofieldiae]GKT69636.1 hypothetical protein ColTof4_02059 [Colletotrichum tofieldiae]